MIRNRLGLPARFLMVATAVACWIPSGAAAGALPVQGAAPTSPQGLTAVAAGPTSITLVWGPPTSTGGNTIIGYQVEVSENVGFTWRLLTTTSATASVYQHLGLPAGATRHYRVRAVYPNASFGTWAYADATTTGTATTGTAPNLTAVAAGPTSITLVWAPPTNTGGNTITGYQVEGSANGGVTWTPLTTTTTNVTVYEHVGVPAGATYHYRVRAVYSTSPVSYGPWAFANATTAAVGVPEAPLNLTATADGSSVIDLDWDAPASSGASAIIDYGVEMSADGGVTWTLLTTTGLTSFRHGSLAAGVTRHYRVRARNANGFGPWTSVVNATTSAGTPPGPPRALTATAVGFLDDRAELERPAEFRQQPDHRVSDRGVEHANRRLERSRGRHGQHAHHLRGHGPRAEHDPLLPGLGDQLLRHGRPLEHRQRHHPAGRAGCAQAIDGRGPRDIGHRVGLDAAIVQRNVRGDRLPHRVVEHEKPADGGVLWPTRVRRRRGTPMTACRLAPRATIASRRSARRA